MSDDELNRPRLRRSIKQAVSKCIMVSREGISISGMVIEQDFSKYSLLQLKSTKNILGEGTSEPP